MQKIVLVAAVLSAFSVAASAAPETFNIEPNHTAARFGYNHLGYSIQQHRFDKTSGKIVLDRAAQTASVDVSIDATSVNTGYAVFNKKIQDEDYFHTAQHPAITFKSTKVTFDGGKPVAVEGDLTIKGVTKPVTLMLTSFHSMPHPMLKKDAIGANAVAKVKRSDFNMGKNVPNIGDEITLSIAVEAIKE